MPQKELTQTRDQIRPSVVPFAYNSSSQEAKAEGSGAKASFHPRPCSKICLQKIISGQISPKAELQNPLVTPHKLWEILPTTISRMIHLKKLLKYNFQQYIRETYVLNISFCLAQKEWMQLKMKVILQRDASQSPTQRTCAHQTRCIFLKRNKVGKEGEMYQGTRRKLSICMNLFLNAQKKRILFSGTQACFYRKQRRRRVRRNSTPFPGAD